MKSMTVISRSRALQAGVAFIAASLVSAQAASTFITFSVDMSAQINNSTFVPGTDSVSANGTFNGYSALNLVQQGSSTVYTNTVNDTADANGGQVQYKFVSSNASGGWENLPTGQNRAAALPSTVGASLVLPTAFYGDAGTPVANNVTFQVDVSQQIALGNFVPGSSSVEVRGLFNGWAGGATPLTANPTILRTNSFGLVTSNVWTGTASVSASPGGAEAFKYVINQLPSGTEWDSPASPNTDGGGNRFFANVAQTLPVVDFSDAPYVPVSQVKFNLDMSVVVLTDTNFNPASVTINGDFNGWGAPVAMTNNPAAANTNIYSAVITIGEGSPVNYQFRYTQMTSGNTVYDHLNGANGGNGNRYYSVPSLANANVAPVSFNDALLDDYLTQPTPVLFSIDMNGAVGTDAHTFDPNSDSVYINGQFANWYAWSGGITPVPAPGGFQMVEQGLTSIYTNTIVIPAGTPVAFNYKYGVDINSANGGPGDNEAGFGLNHYRVVRSTAVNPYTMPTDKFGTTYGEPFFNSGNTAGAALSVGSVSAGKVPVTWLGRPGAHLQVSTNLLAGGWRDLAGTDGTNWAAGYNSPNGLVSQTNWPAGLKAYFRLVKP